MTINNITTFAVAVHNQEHAAKYLINKVYSLSAIFVTSFTANGSKS